MTGRAASIDAGHAVAGVVAIHAEPFAGLETAGNAIARRGIVEPDGSHLPTLRRARESAAAIRAPGRGRGRHPALTKPPDPGRPAPAGVALRPRRD